MLHWTVNNRRNVNIGVLAVPDYLDIYDLGVLIWNGSYSLDYLPIAVACAPTICPVKDTSDFTAIVQLVPFLLT